MCDIEIVDDRHLQTVECLYRKETSLGLIYVSAQSTQRPLSPHEQSNRLAPHYVIAMFPTYRRFIFLYVKTCRLVRA